MKSGSRRYGAAFLSVAAVLMASALVGGCHKGGDAGGDAGASSDSGGGGKKGHGAGSASAAVPPTPVQVQVVKNGTVSQTVAVTGNVNALHDVQVAAKTPGRVLTVNFREGDFVKAGTILVQQDATDLQANVRSDIALIASDQAKLDQARETLAIQKTQAQQNVLNARATLNAANENYLKYKRGNRPQDILQAEATTLQAKSQRDQALITLNRDKVLYPQGAIAKSALDADQSTYDSDQALFLKAQAAEALEKAGYQQEDINAAQEQKNEQVANLANAIGNQRQVQVQKGAVESALAVLQQDHAKLQYDQTQVTYTIIKCPIDGVVAARETEPGELATSGTALMRIVDIATLYYEPTISETDFSETHVGDTVRVNVDAVPGQTFHARIAALYPAADPTTRVFSMRVMVDNTTRVLRPGMFARGTLVTKVARNVTIIPTSALVTAAAPVGFEANDSSDAPVSQGVQLPAQQVAVVNSDGKTVSIRPVTLGIVTMQNAQVTSGLQVGDKIVVVGQQGLKNNDPISEVTAQGGDTVSGGGSGHHKGKRGGAGGGGTAAGGADSASASASPGATGGDQAATASPAASDSAAASASPDAPAGDSATGAPASGAPASGGGHHHHHGAGAAAGGGDGAGAPASGATSGAAPAAGSGN